VTAWQLCKRKSSAAVIAPAATGKGTGEMTKTKRTSVLLSLAGALLGASATVVLANPAGAAELLHGEYIVAQSTSVPAAVNIAVTGTKNGQTGTQTVRCWLPKGVDSQGCWSAQLDLTLMVNLIEENAGVGKIEIDFMPLEIYAVDHGYDVVAIEPDEPDVHAAEGYFDWWNGAWACSVEQADVDKCNLNCGLGGGVASAEPRIPSNNPFFEPECEVECSCNDGTDGGTWIDPPQVLPAG
jgi:hypothetical protein